MSLIKALNILVAADTSRFDKPIKKTGSNFDKFRKHVTAHGATLGKGIAIGAAAAAAGLTALTVASMKNVDELTRNSNLIGVSVTSLKELQGVATKTDLSTDTLTQGMKKLGMSLSEAATTGKGKAAEALKTLGLSAGELQQMTPDERLKKIATAMEGIADPGDRAALASKLFSKAAGPEMATFLAMGAKGIEKTRERVIELGGSLSQLDANKIGAANDSMDDLSILVDGIGNRFAAAVAPYIATATENLLDFGIVGATSTDNITTGLEHTIEACGHLGDALQNLKNNFGEAQTGVAEVFQEAIRHSGGLLTGLVVGDIIDEKDFKDVASYMDTELAGQHERNKANWEAPPISEGLKKWREQAAQLEAKMREQMGNNPIKIPVEIDDDEDAIATKLEKIRDKWHDELMLMQEGLKGKDAEIFQLRQDGADEGDLAQLQQLADWQKEIDDATKKEKELAAAAKAVNDQLATPYEKAADELLRLEELRDGFFITQDQFDRSRANIEKDLFGGLKSENRLPSLIEEGSQEAAQAIVRHRFANQGNKDDTASKTLSETIQMRRTMKQIEKNTGNTVTVDF